MGVRGVPHPVRICVTDGWVPMHGVIRLTLTPNGIPQAKTHPCVLNAQRVLDTPYGRIGTLFHPTGGHLTGSGDYHQTRGP